MTYRQADVLRSTSWAILNVFCTDPFPHTRAALPQRTLNSPDTAALLSFLIPLKTLTPIFTLQFPNLSQIQTLTLTRSCSHHSHSHSRQAKPYSSPFPRTNHSLLSSNQHFLQHSRLYTLQ